MINCFRLDSKYDEHFAAYSKWRERVRRFALQYTPDSPIEPILYEIDQRWTTAGNLAGYFLGIDAGRIYAHVASWIITAYGRNKLYIYQAESDDHARANLPLFMGEIQRWVADLNEKLLPTLRIEKFELATWHDPAIFCRYLNQLKLGAVKSISVIEGNLFNG